MTESERKIIVKKIENIKTRLKLKEMKKIRKQELEKSREVKEYLLLLQEIDALETELNLFKNETDVINWQFAQALDSKFNEKGITSCKHDIWLYEGSYNLWEDPYGEFDKEYITRDETNDNFCYNKYICLECGKEVKEQEWENFEEINLVLKDRDIKNISYYRNLYYQFLYNSSVCKSQQLIINEFNKKKIKRK